MNCLQFSSPVCVPSCMSSQPKTIWTRLYIDTVFTYISLFIECLFWLFLLIDWVPLRLHYLQFKLWKWEQSWEAITISKRFIFNYIIQILILMSPIATFVSHNLISNAMQLQVIAQKSHAVSIWRTCKTDICFQRSAGLWHLHHEVCPPILFIFWSIWH